MNKMTIPVSPKENTNAAFSRGINVIFKGLNKCNAGCTFCCIGDPGGSIISWNDFSHMVTELEALIAGRDLQHMTFTFHGGEPTLLKARLLDRMCERIRELPVTVAFNMQSNMISLPTSVKTIIEKHKIKVGTSIDPMGTDRVLQNGKNGFPTWLKTYVRYAIETVPPGAIYVITRHSLGREEFIYDLCETLGSLTGQRFALQLNPVYAQGKASEQVDDMSITPDEYGSFMVNFWRSWEKNRRSISITPIQSFANHFLPNKFDKAPHLACTYNGNCPGSHIGIDYDLNVAGCGRRLDSHAFIGNLHKDSLVTIMDENEERALLSNRADTLRLSECQDCEYFDICHGGCPDDAWLAEGSVKGKTHWCQAHKMLFAAMNNEIRAIRRPASTPPAIPRSDNDLLKIFLAPGCDDVPDRLDNRSEIWMLPDPEGSWLQFDSELAQRQQSHMASRMRLWCYNKQVSSLMMWEDLLHKKGVSIVLFQADGLSEAMNILNSMKALIILDVASIIKQKGGSDILKQVMDRYLGDPLWKSQILPFSQMIKSYINREPIRLYNEFGLGTGNYTVIPPAENEIEEKSFSHEIAERLKRDSGTAQTEWFLSRRPCTECDHYRFCSMRFSHADEGMCDERIRAIVKQVHDTARKIQNYLHDTN